MGRFAVIIVSTLIILMIFFILSTNQTNTASQQRNINTLQFNQSRYIAYSASQIAVSKFKTSDWNIEMENTVVYFPVNIDSYLSWNELGGTYRIEAVKSGNFITITTRGLQSDSDVVATVVVVIETSGGMPNFESALYSNSSITLTGSSEIYGNTGTAASETNSVNFGWSTRVNGNFQVGPGADYNDVIFSAGWGRTPHDNITGVITNLDNIPDYPLPPYPSFPDPVDRGDLLITSNPATRTIDEDGKYGTIRITGNRTLNIIVGSGNRIIRVSNLVIEQGAINIIGEGTLTLYVDDSFSLGGSSSINSSGSSSKVHMYYSGGGTVNPSGSTSYRGSIYIKTASITIGGSGGIQGHIVSGGTLVSVTGNAEANVRVLYAPNAAVILNGSGRVRGAIIAGSFSAEGNARVFFQEIDSEIPDIGFGSGEGFSVVNWN